MTASPSYDSPENLCICHECDLRQARVALPAGGTGRCRRCGAALYHELDDTLDRTLALALGGFILFAVANAFPILGLNIQGNQSQATLWQAVLQLREQGMNAVAGLVMFTTLAAPLLQVLGLIYVLLPLRLGFRVRGQHAVFRLIQLLKPWGMIEVFMLGVLVALVKLAHLASIVPGWSLWLFGGFMFVMAGALATLDAEEIWDRLGLRDARPLGSETDGTLLGCHCCCLLSRLPPDRHELPCPRCGTVLHTRKPDSLERCWALLAAAVILYIPANLLPIMISSSVAGTQADTILSGVVFLWQSGSWPLALVVFFASIMVPMLKLFVLSFLLISIQIGSTWRPLDRTRLYRMTEAVGRWSMVDIFVVTILVALVNAKPLALVQAGPGAIAFGAVVVLTMLAAMSFDPRLIWDSIERKKRVR